jgi:imidazole glycerol phosphate synthase glutamine amidotransferase subunit
VSIVVVDSGGANIASVLHALRRQGVDPVFSADANTIRAAGRVILPGVGAAGQAMDVLRTHGLVDVIRSLVQPVLGICLGMQLLFSSSAEDDAERGNHTGATDRLGLSEGLRVPHMGWNTLTGSGQTAQRSADWPVVHFVHSAAPLGEWTLASANHGSAFSALVRKEIFTAPNSTLSDLPQPEHDFCGIFWPVDSRQRIDMYIIPAIDLLDGEVVRLRQGDFDQARRYAVTGLQLARNYAAAGAKWLHVVDLAASRDGSSGQPEILLRLLQSAPQSVQTGGGVRRFEDISKRLEHGARRVVVGTLCVTQTQSFLGWLEEFGADRIVSALDVEFDAAGTPWPRIHGWTVASERNLWDLLDEFCAHGLKHLRAPTSARTARWVAPTLPCTARWWNAIRTWKSRHRVASRACVIWSG